MVLGMMKEYDFIFSLGASCAATQTLRDCGLQFTSLPLDWAASPGIAFAAEMIVNGFPRWFERGDLVLHDVRHEEGAVQRVYYNRYTHFGFPHEFTNAKPFEKCFDEVREKYFRRIARLDKLLSAKPRALGVYLEVATRRAQPLDALLKVRSDIVAKYPGLKLDLIYIHELPGKRIPEIETETDGVTIVAADYAKFLNGVPMHTVDRTELVRFFHENFTVAGHDIAAEKAAYEREQKKMRKSHWGKGVIEKWINRKLFKTYRRLQDYLIAQRLLPGDRPCWFEESDKAWPYWEKKIEN